jgi:citrate synthase
MLWEASVLDPLEVRISAELTLASVLILLHQQGIRFHGMTIKECQASLPPAPGGKEMIAESMLWLLLTGHVPNEAQTRQLSHELAEKGRLPPFVEKLVDSYCPFYCPGWDLQH